MASQIKTWHIEAAIAAILLASVAFIGGRGQDWLAAAAVLFTFTHTQVAERLRERQQTRQTADVECYKKLTGYLIVKEICWVGFFLMTQSYPALVGCGIFLVYPAWRKWWRTKYPIILESK